MVGPTSYLRVTRKHKRHLGPASISTGSSIGQANACLLVALHGHKPGSPKVTVNLRWLCSLQLGGQQGDGVAMSLKDSMKLQRFENQCRREKMADESITQKVTTFNIFKALILQLQ